MLAEHVVPVSTIKSSCGRQLFHMAVTVVTSPAAAAAADPWHRLCILS
jgi:hypothetical protein